MREPCPGARGVASPDSVDGVESIAIRVGGGYYRLAVWEEEAAPHLYSGRRAYALPRLKAASAGWKDRWTGNGGRLQAVLPRGPLVSDRRPCSPNETGA